MATHSDFRLDVSLYEGAHGDALQLLLGGPTWREVLQSGLIDEVRDEGIPPGSTRDYVGTVVDQLLAFNHDRVREMIRDGETDQDVLLEVLSTWPERLSDQDPILSFLGLTVTTQCNFDPRCVYCNQTRVDRSVTLEEWKRVILEATTTNDGVGPYIYITGGEPLLLEDEIWGEDGLVRFASERGAAVNVNTNATRLTPEVALRLVKAGLSKLHISIDTSDASVQEELFSGRALATVLEGIYNVQIARDLVGVSYPVIHTNCVLTCKNIDLVPDLFAMILSKRKRLANKRDPLYYDLFPHVIPVGGDENRDLRPSEQAFRRFYEQIWPQIEGMWKETQDELCVSEEQKGPMFGYFSSPFLRVFHEGGIDAYAKASASGEYGRLALSRTCYVAPTQASFSPDGLQFRCGSHAIRRIHSIGTAGEGGVLENIRASVNGQETFPKDSDCYGCALATLHINQTVEARLMKQLGDLLAVRRTGTQHHGVSRQE